MRERYWAMYTSIKHKEYYYQHYLIHSKRISGAITGFCAIFSTASIVSWTGWAYTSWLWAIIVVALQIIQALSPHIPFSKQLVALKFLLPQLSNLMLEIDSEWRNIDNYKNKKINVLIDKFTKRYADLESQFVEDTYFPKLNNCEKKAQQDCLTYFHHYYNVKE